MVTGMVRNMLQQLILRLHTCTAMKVMTVFIYADRKITEHMICVILLFHDVTSTGVSAFCVTTDAPCSMSGGALWSGDTEIPFGEVVSMFTETGVVRLLCSSSTTSVSPLSKFGISSKSSVCSSLFSSPAVSVADSVNYKTILQYWK